MNKITACYWNAALVILVISFLAACNQTSETPSDVTVLTGATIFDGNGNTLTGKNILIRNGEILEITEAGAELPNGAEVIDLEGKYIMPGLVDAHIHFSQTGFFDGRPDALDLTDSLPYAAAQQTQKNHPERYYETYLRSGITAIYDVGGAPWSLEFQESAESDMMAPHVAAAGPLITAVPAQRIAWFNTEEDSVMYPLSSAEDGRRYVRSNNRRGATGIKIWGLFPGDTAFVKNIKAVQDETEKVGNSLIIHATSLEQAKMALRLGARLLVHSVDDTLVDEEFLQMMKENNTLYNPTLQVSRNYVVAMRAVLGEKPFVLNDPQGAMDEDTRNLLENAVSYRFLTDTVALKQRAEARVPVLAERTQTMHENLRRVYEAGGEIVVGTDAGNPGTFHGLSYYDELEEMQEAGIAPEDLIVMATRNGARAMQRLDDFGTLEAGKMADLIIMEKDPSENISNVRTTTHVMRGGVLRPVDQSLD